MVLSKEGRVPRGVVRVGRAGEQIDVEPIDKFIGGIGQVARDFLLDGAALLIPLRLGIINAAHAGGLGLEGDVEIGGGQRGVVLGDVLLGIRIVVAAQLRVDGSGLIGGHAAASAEGHVLLGVRHSGETVRRFIAADHEVGLDGDHGRQRIPDDDHVHAVGQGGAGGGRFGGAQSGRGRECPGGKQQSRQNHRTLQNNPPVVSFSGWYWKWRARRKQGGACRQRGPWAWLALRR